MEHILDVKIWMWYFSGERPAMKRKHWCIISFAYINASVPFPFPIQRFLDNQLISIKSVTKFESGKRLLAPHKLFQGK